MSMIYTAPICELKTLNNIFIELTAKSCNTRCRECFIKFPYTKRIKDFIKADIVKKMLNDTRSEDIKCIYLTGAEPMTHPDFNSILRLCLKRANVCIMTNGSFINEKKSRFLKNVEDEGANELFFRLSFTHYDEEKNDAVRYRGSYRQNIFALKCLNKYGFSNIINVSNYYNEPHNLLISKFREKLDDIGVENAVIQVSEWARDTMDEIPEITGKTDCMSSRTLTVNGVFSCPFLANDYRGRMGSDFSNYSRSIRLETNYCATCLKNNDNIFSIEIEQN